MRVLVLLVFTVGIIMTVACSQASAPPSNTSSQSAEGRGGRVEQARGAGGAGASQDAAARAPSAPNTTSAQTGLAEAPIPRLDRMVIANVTMHLSADNAVTVAREAERIAATYGGFVGSSNVKDLESGREASMTLRIPGASAMDALADLRLLGKKVIDEARSTEDVTEEYTDVESNVRNLRSTEARILTLIERSSNLTEVLTLQRELTNIRGQIEKLEGRRRVLDSRSSYANISLRITEPTTVQPKKSWNLADTATQALSVLAGLGQVLATMLVWVIVFSPIWGIPVVIAWWIARQRPSRPAVSDTANAG